MKLLNFVLCILAVGNSHPLEGRRADTDEILIDFRRDLLDDKENLQEMTISNFGMNSESETEIGNLFNERILEDELKKSEAKSDSQMSPLIAITLMVAGCVAALLLIMGTIIISIKMCRKNQKTKEEGIKQNAEND